MSKNSIRKLKWLKVAKRDLVERFGCSQCTAGQIKEGFERYWVSDPEPYEPRRYTFYHDVAGRGPVSQEALKASVTLGQLKDLVSLSAIICRGCRTCWAKQKEQRQREAFQDAREGA